ncbi:lipopolysaccharide core biosynthesis protein [Escherichia coli]|nr:lipopolysaccharide core biosynthesis protein [Escherichia coli]
MIQKSKIKDLVVFTDENNSKYLNVLNDFLSYNINIIKVFRSIDDTKVMLIDTDYGKLILKVFSPKVKRNERFFKDGANKQVISSQADSLIKISRIWADFFPANTSNQPI